MALSPSIPDGTINYTPNANFNGTDTINYTVTDPGGLTSSASVTVIIDNDRDGVDNATDIDDDNDGILDEVEYGNPNQNHIINGSFETADGTHDTHSAVSGSQGSFALPGWTIIGDIDLGESTVFGNQDAVDWATGGQFIDLLGNAPYDSSLLVNGSFEDDDLAGTHALFAPSALTGWNTDHVTEVQHNSLGFQTALDGDQWVELDAGSAEVDNLYQDVQTVSGQPYQLNLAVSQRSGYSTNTVEVYWNGVLVDSIDPVSTNWETHTNTTSPEPVGMDRLEFRETSAGNDGVGSLIDNVSLFGPRRSQRTA